MRAPHIIGGQRSWLAIAGAGLAAVLAAIPIPAGAANLAAGAQWFPLCASCHGDRAEGNPALHAPRLQGLSAVYLLRQIQDFRSGRRGDNPRDRFGQEMKSMAGTLPSDAAAQDVAAYIAALKEPVAPAEKGDLSTVVAYQTCAGCHGKQAEGNPAVGAPRLAGQDVAYLLRQLEGFRVGWRGTAPGDTQGQQMVAIARAIPEQTSSQAVAQVGARSQQAAAGKSR